MKPPCELIVGKILPSIRAAIVKILIEEYRLKQTEIAGLLGISQSAVSQYYTSTRGADHRFLLLFPEILKYAREIADDLTKGKIKGYQISLCIPCQKIRAEKKFKEVQDDFLQLKECKICEPDIDEIHKGE
jgi:predicted transcriptional regulator